MTRTYRPDAALRCGFNNNVLDINDSHSHTQTHSQIYFISVFTITQFLVLNGELMENLPKAYSFYPVEDDSLKYSYSNGELFARKAKKTLNSNSYSTVTVTPSPTHSHTQVTTRTTTSTTSTTLAASTSSTNIDSAQSAACFLPLANDGNCKCGNCIDMPTSIENKCCVNEELHRTNLQDDNFIPSENTCILQSKLLTDHLLGEVNVQLSWFRQQRYFGLTGDSLLFSNMTNSNSRFHAYRNYIDFIYGYLGKKNRKVIPACVVGHIRTKWPDSDHIYMGYKQAVGQDEADHDDNNEMNYPDELELFMMDGGN